MTPWKQMLLLLIRSLVVLLAVLVSSSVLVTGTKVVPDSGVYVRLGNWTLEQAKKSGGDGNGGDPILVTNATGEVLTDLMKAGILDDPYIDQNFLTQRDVYYNHTWTYSTIVEIPPVPRTTTITSWRLVVEGIKMGANLYWNDRFLGVVKDQFLRYSFPLPDELQQQQQRLSSSSSSSSLGGKNSNKALLKVELDPTIPVDGRFTACSGGWNWAPYAQQVDVQGKRMWTKGIVQPIYLVGIQHYAITHVVPKIYHLGTTTTNRSNITNINNMNNKRQRRQLRQAHNGDFHIDVCVYLQFADTITAASEDSIPPVRVESPEFGNYTIPVTPPSFGKSSSSSINTGMVRVSMIAPQDKVKLWWPNGMGEQPLYDIFVSIAHDDDDRNNDDDKSVITKKIHKRIGFRTVAMVTINETDTTSTASNANSASSASATTMMEGSGQHGMYFRVNGALVLARGANVIPMDQLEGRLTDEAHRIMVESAAMANMNMLRVWGGGMVLPEAFYEACDELGILLYHDMMFVDEAGHGPLVTETVEHEIRHLIRSLASHTSIVVWSGCNECQVVMGTPNEIYATFVLQTVAEEDDTRSIWPSSPSYHGWRSGVFTKDGRPNGKPLATRDPKAFPNKLEDHGPYLWSFSNTFPGVNGLDVGFPYENTPPKLKEVDIGIQFPNRFSSEFGSTVMSSFESMTGTLNRKLWSLHGNAPPDKCKHFRGNENTCTGSNVLAQRNYPCDTHIDAYFNSTSLDAVGEKAFQAQLYLCLMSQTLWMKGEIEKRRSTNSFGLLIWQLNENWPTGGWGVIEYGTKDTSNSQVVGGRWKPLMHLLASSLFCDVFLACGKDNRCYIRNDGSGIVNAVISMEAWALREEEPTEIFTYSISLKAGGIFWYPLPRNIRIGNDVLLISVHDKNNLDLLQETVFLWDMPKNIPGLHAPVSVVIESIRTTTNGTALVTMQSDHLALFVVLTTRAQGRFSENSFSLRPKEPKTIEFLSLVSVEPVDVDMLKSTVRIEHLGIYMSSGVLTASSEV